MGQQQLLLLVLGIVIVGLAVVVGIQAFGENQAKANRDAMVNDAIRIASDAQAWALKPTAFGGNAGNEAGVFAGLDFTKLGYSVTDGDYVNVNGTYELSETPTTSFTIQGTSSTNDESQVCVTVGGLEHTDITTEMAACAS